MCAVGRVDFGSIYVFYIRLYIRFGRCGDGFVFWFLCLVVETGVLLSQLQHLLLQLADSCVFGLKDDTTEKFVQSSSLSSSSSNELK